MPVTSTKQARVELTAAQAETVASLVTRLGEDPDRHVVGIAVEETNLGSTISVMTAEAHNRIFMIAVDGSETLLQDEAPDA